MANIEKQHEIVKTSLFKFVNEHITGADLSVVDEIVLSYVISILEEASTDTCVDIEGNNNTNILTISDHWFHYSNKILSGFIEMMSAYFPEFSRIHTQSVCTWMYQLEKQLSSLNQAAESQNFSLK